MNSVETFSRHPKTGLPVQPVPTFEVGDLVTEGVGSDAYPGVVVAVTPKTVWVASVQYAVSAQPDDIPGYNGYGDSATMVVDPESVERAKAKGKEGATKYVLRVASTPSVSGTSFAERERYGAEGFHRAGWKRPGGWGYLSAGASYRRDPHL